LHPNAKNNEGKKHNINLAAPMTTVVVMTDPTQSTAPLTNGDSIAVKDVEEAGSYTPNGYVHGQINSSGVLNSAQCMPPQQVYLGVAGISPVMTGLENQFQSMAMVPPDPGVALDEPEIDGEHADEGDHDEETNDEDPLKLFVGQVPKSLSEEDIFPVFEPFGPLKDLAIIRDKHTGLHRGCAFVTYWTSGDGERAQTALHDKFTFAGGRRPAQVKPAEPSGTENKLFIGMLSRKAGEPEVREIFAPFGEIREIYMIRNADGSSKCAAFLRYVERDSAIKAIESLNHSIVMDGATRPLIVKFADNKHQRQARAHRNARRDQFLGFMRAGPYPGYQMQIPGPMTVPPQYQIPAYPPQQAAAYPPQQAAYTAAPTPHHPQLPTHPYMYPHHLMGAVPAYPFPTPNRQPEMRAPNPRPREGPAGANLFVYHLPHDLTDADLATAFNPFGNVISAKVYVDRNTGESKGFGFVSYDSVIAAESAIEQMNGFQIGNKRLKVQHKRVNNTMPPDMNGPFVHPIPPGAPIYSGPMPGPTHHA